MKLIHLIISILVLSLVPIPGFAVIDQKQELSIMHEQKKPYFDIQNLIHKVATQKNISDLSIQWELNSKEEYIAIISAHGATQTIYFTKDEILKPDLNSSNRKINEGLSALLENTREPTPRKHQ